ncbi:Uncharacterised protein [[Clostridium] sordellii]|uniref:hypothetical protein n=1 Tax=Paraclostridium sordellii TaxID=1505 RepID=UPI0005E23DC2|nr:hypothetical protein [Paeniclostridium sordellii]CEQ10646.1 Uncharacterised protein [[Clostridium] sordellii] [Paeniclostridium sordellii]
MKIKKFLFYNLKYFLFIVVLYIAISNLGFRNEVIKYIKFETTNLNFQDLLSISITVLSICVGAIITVATVLISMCDKRILKLINKYGKSKYLVSTIKIAIISGISVIFLLAIIYAKLDFNVMLIKYILIYLSGLMFGIFISKSSILISIILNILNDAFDTSDSLVIEAEFNKDME